MLGITLFYTLLTTVTFFACANLIAISRSKPKKYARIRKTYGGLYSLYYECSIIATGTMPEIEQKFAELQKTLGEKIGVRIL